MTTTSISRTTRQNRLRLILSGIQKHFSGVTSITLGGQPEALADLTSRIQADIAASDTYVQAQAELATEVQAENASHAALDPLLRLFKLYVVAQFGDAVDASTELADFGYAPRKTATRSLETKTEAAEKALATRAARHTMGPKARLEVTGTTAPTTPAPAGPSNGTTATPAAAPKSPS